MEEMNRIPEEVVAGNGAITANEEPIEAVAQETDVAVEVPGVEPVAAEQAEEPAEEAVGDADGAEGKSTQTPQLTRTVPPQIRLDRRHILDDGNDLVMANMPVDTQRREIRQMEMAIAAGTVCYGRIIAVEEVDHKYVRIIVKRDTLRIVIPAEDFFYHSDMKDIEKATDDERFIRYRRKASHMFEAAVSFLPKGIGYDEDGIPFVIASRKQAMDKLQELHFFGPRADVHVGSVAKASIVSTGPRYVTVECLGIESVIGTGGLSAFAYIEDASQEFRVGEGLMVAVEKLDVDKENRTIDISLSHALIERSEAKVEMANEKMMNGRYIASVVAVLPKYYVVIIKGLKVRGLIPLENYNGVDPLLVGDDVVMLVTGINKERNMAIGRCIKA